MIHGSGQYSWGRGVLWEYKDNYYRQIASDGIKTPKFIKFYKTAKNL